MERGGGGALRDGQVGERTERERDGGGGGGG